RQAGPPGRARPGRRRRRRLLDERTGARDRRARRRAVRDGRDRGRELLADQDLPGGKEAAAVSHRVRADRYGEDGRRVRRRGAADEQSRRARLGREARPGRSSESGDRRPGRRRRLHADLLSVVSRWRLIGTALARGLRKRCPHCGEGRLFAGWAHIDRCSICGLVFVRNPGDTWAFTIIGDRVPIGIIIVLIYFGVVRSHRALGLALLVMLGVVLIWTAPNRWGVGIALHYLSRVYWPEPADPIPPPHVR